MSNHEASDDDSRKPLLRSCSLRQEIDGKNATFVIEIQDQQNIFWSLFVLFPDGLAATGARSAVWAAHPACHPPCAPYHGYRHR